MKIFISWSGIASRHVAEALSDWLPKVIQGVEPFVSAKDIDKGSNWTVELARELENAEFGIICLAPDNLFSPWLNYEAGAITRSVDSRVAPVLFEVEKSDVKPPLAQLQLTTIEQGEFEQLLLSINKAAGNRLSSANVEEAVRVWWPMLETAIGEIEKPNVASRPEAEVPAEPAQPQVDLTEMVEEVLHRVRGLDSRVRRIERGAPRATSRGSSRMSAAARFLQRVSETADLEIETVTETEKQIDVVFAETLPDPLPPEMTEAGLKVAAKEQLEVRFYSPDRVVLFSVDGKTIEAPF